MRPFRWGAKSRPDGEANQPVQQKKLEQKSTGLVEEPNRMEGYEPQIVEVVENTIYFYADIDREKVLKLNRTIHTLNNDLLWKSQITNHTPPNIYLNINSHGGSIFDAFSVIDSILNSKIPVYTTIDGCAASAASLITIVGKKRFIKRHSYVLIHQLSSFMMGKYMEFKDEMQNLDKFMQMIRGVYKKHTKVPMKKLDEILEHDLWFDAEEAVELGIADEIL